MPSTYYVRINNRSTFPPLRRGWLRSLVLDKLILVPDELILVPDKLVDRMTELGQPGSVAAIPSHILNVYRVGVERSRAAGLK